MKHRVHARYVTLAKGDIDPNTSTELVWDTEENTLTIILFRISHEKSQPRLSTEEIGPFGLVQQGSASSSPPARDVPSQVGTVLQSLIACRR